LWVSLAAASMEVMRLIAALVMAGLLLSAASPAVADEDRVRRHGSCSGGPSEWRLIVRQETATTLRVRWEIERGEPNQVWQLFLSDNGTRFYAGTKTSDNDGSVRVRRFTRDRDGSDRIKGSGVNLETGETCYGSVLF
jgi:hypothetical protein